MGQTARIAGTGGAGQILSIESRRRPSGKVAMPRGIAPAIALGGTAHPTMDPARVTSCGADARRRTHP